MDTKQKSLLVGGALGGLFLGANAPKILKGLTLGLITIGLAFILIFQSVNGVRENSESVRSLPLKAASSVAQERGMVKIYGKLQSSNLLNLQVEECVNNSCEEFSNLLTKDGLVYRKIVLQRFEVIRKVEKKESSGTTDTETVTYSHEWVTKSNEETWAEVAIDGIKLDASKARTLVGFESAELANPFIPKLDVLETYGRTPLADEPAFGATRAIVTYLPLTEQEYLVVGELRSGTINSGDPFILTDKSETELAAQLGGEETTTRWIMRFISFLLLTFGFTSMLSPILVFTDLIPLAGNVARGTATFSSGILAAISVLATVFLLNYWWAILLLIILSILGFAYISLRKQSGKNTSAKD